MLEGRFYRGAYIGGGTVTLGLHEHSWERPEKVSLEQEGHERDRRAARIDKRRPDVVSGSGGGGGSR